MENPFTKRREKKEAQLRERMGMQQEQQLGLPSEEVMMAPPAMAQMQLESSDGQDPYA